MRKRNRCRKLREDGFAIHIDGISEDKAQVYGVDLSLAFEIRIREIVREKIAKIGGE